MFNHTLQNDFKKIPGEPIAYWVSDIYRDIFTQSPALSSIAKPRQGLATSDNNRFLKLWYEPSLRKINFSAKDRADALNSQAKWFPCQKGGSYRKWFGNHEYLVNWENDGRELLDFAASLYGSPTRTIKISLFILEKVQLGRQFRLVIFQLDIAQLVLYQKPKVLFVLLMIKIFYYRS